MDEKAGALLAQAVTTQTAKAAFKAHEVTIKENSFLAKAAKEAMQTRQLSLKKRQKIEKVVREKLLHEQKVNWMSWKKQAKYQLKC